MMTQCKNCKNHFKIMLPTTVSPKFKCATDFYWQIACSKITQMSILTNRPQTASMIVLVLTVDSSGMFISRRQILFKFRSVPAPMQSDENQISINFTPNSLKFDFLQTA